tara:strand:+ start:11018 stop:12598 length:1581 start_codon:yes stop_codon:yes gene_type:complete
MTKTRKNFLFLLLIFFSVYCSFVIGRGWDEEHLLKQGRIAVNYLFSLGKIEDEIFRREFYSPIYYSLKYLLIQSFPIKYHIEASHIINLFFSFGVIIGLKKLCKEFFNNDVANIAFLILFFFPAFNGHMGLNSKDTIIALCHVWIFYLCIQYLKKQNSKVKRNEYLIYLALFAAVGSGINFFFLGSLLPVFIFILFDIFLKKKFSCTNFNRKKLLVDICKCFLFFYILLIVFWIDTHQNILLLPIKFLSEWFFGDIWRGYPYILLNGEYFLYKEIPKSYLFITFIFKSPEYFLLTYVLFLFIYMYSKDFFTKKFPDFNYKLLTIISMVLFPFLLLLLTPFSIYDGLRHVLWMIPYTCIIPALTIYYFFKKINYFTSKAALLSLIILIGYFLHNFLLITPYQYTYLNTFSGKIENRYKKFENDYWGSSLKELINKINLDKNSVINIATCGVSVNVVKEYLKKKGFKKIRYGNPNNSNYIIMTNRVTPQNANVYKSENLVNCFDKFQGKDIFKVSRNGMTLSVIRKIN